MGQCTSSSSMKDSVKIRKTINKIDKIVSALSSKIAKNESSYGGMIKEIVSNLKKKKLGNAKIELSQLLKFKQQTKNIKNKVAVLRSIKMTLEQQTDNRNVIKVIDKSNKCYDPSQEQGAKSTVSTYQTLQQQQERINNTLGDNPGINDSTKNETDSLLEKLSSKFNDSDDIEKMLKNLVND